MAKKTVLTYEEAMAQLEQIVRQVEQNELGIDQLVEQLKKATELVAYCKEKLYNTDKDISTSNYHTQKPRNTRRITKYRLL